MLKIQISLQFPYLFARSTIICFKLHLFHIISGYGLLSSHIGELVQSCGINIQPSLQIDNYCVILSGMLTSHTSHRVALRGQ